MLENDAVECYRTGGGWYMYWMSGVENFRGLSSSGIKFMTDRRSSTTRGQPPTGALSFTRGRPKSHISLASETVIFNTSYGPFATSIEMKM